MPVLFEEYRFCAWLLSAMTSGAADPSTLFFYQIVVLAVVIADPQRSHWSPSFSAESSMGGFKITSSCYKGDLVKKTSHRLILCLCQTAAITIIIRPSIRALDRFGGHARHPLPRSGTLSGLAHRAVDPRFGSLVGASGREVTVGFRAVRKVRRCCGRKGLSISIRLWLPSRADCSSSARAPIAQAANRRKISESAGLVYLSSTPTATYWHVRQQISERGPRYHRTCRSLSHTLTYCVLSLRNWTERRRMPISCWLWTIAPCRMPST